MAVTDHVVTNLPYADAGRMAAAGGSYGGYMIDWILGHTQRFKALISHDGVYDLRSEFGDTEELWFPLWEFGGTPWDNPEMYANWSPSHFAKEFHTPTLVIHGELDFRVPVHAGPAAVHRAANAEGAVEAAGVSRRRPLGAEAAEQPALVQNVYRLDRFLDEKVKVILAIAAVLISRCGRACWRRCPPRHAITMDPPVKADRRQHSRESAK